MRRALLLSISLLIFSFSFGQQGERIVKNISLSAIATEQETEGELPFFNTLPFFSYFVEYPEGKIELSIQFSKNGSTWTKPEALIRDEHNSEKHITQLYFGEADYSHYRIRTVNKEGDVPFIKLHFFTPGETAPPNLNPNSSARDVLACVCPMPDFQDRNDWCSTSECPEHPSPEVTEVTHLIIHHSAGTTTSDNWPAIVRAIWDYHVNGNGWSDIGYNWLIDANGVIYQGRNDNILGAHFCAQNGRTMGVCMMGTYTDVTPTEEALNSLEQLLAWKSCDRDIAPLESSLHSSSGLTLHHISGHKDGCNTACPGDSLHPLLPNIRQGVYDLIESDCTVLATNHLGLAQESLILSPNPAENQLSIQFRNELKGDLHWQIINVHQQPVLNGLFSKEHLLFQGDITLNELTAGIYFLQLDIEGKKGIWRVVKI